MSNSRFFNLLDTKVNQNCLLFSENEREREREGENTVVEVQSRRGGGVVQWCWVNFQCWGVLLI